MFFYHFLQLCPRGHISKMLAVTVIKNTVISAFGIFKSVSCLIQMRLSKNFFFKHVLLSFSSTLSPRSHLENACCNRYSKKTVISAFGIFKSVSCLIQMRLSKNFFSNMFFYHFLQLCPRGHISKMLAVTVIKNTVISAFGIFKSVSCLIQMRLSKNFFSNMFFYHFLQLCPRGHISKMLAVTVIQKTR